MTGALGTTTTDTPRVKNSSGGARRAEERMTRGIIINRIPIVARSSPHIASHESNGHNSGALSSQPHRTLLLTTPINHAASYPLVLHTHGSTGLEYVRNCLSSPPWTAFLKPRTSTDPRTSVNSWVRLFNPIEFAKYTVCSGKTHAKQRSKKNKNC